MLPDYEDIRSRIDEEPKWYDIHGVPRYCEMHPNEVPNIHADAVWFQETACQLCGEKFNVAFHSSRMMRIKTDYFELDTVDMSFPLHYGDPPRHGCTGDTMNVVDSKILQTWKRNGGKHGYEWVRVDTTE